MEINEHTNSSERIIYLDVLRGVALLGILTMNIPVLALGNYADYSPLTEGIKGPDFQSWFWGTVFFSGKMRALFGLLFGAGIILFTEKKAGENSLPVADAYIRRMLWLLLFGLINSYLLLFTSDVLYLYAFCGILLFAFRTMKPRGLIIMSLLILSLYSLGQGLIFLENQEHRKVWLQTETLVKQGKKISEEQKAERKIWEDLVARNFPFTKERKAEIKTEAEKKFNTMRSGYGTVFEELMPETIEIETTGFYKGAWESFATIMLGMALFKLGVFSGRLNKKAYLWLMFLGLGIGLPLSYCATNAFYVRAAFVKIYFEKWYVSAFTFEQLPRVILTLGYVGLFMLICVSGWMKGVQKILAAVGRMAFTNYLMQSFITTFIFFGYGFGMAGKFSRYELWYFIFAIWLFQIIFSVVWLRFFTMGPLEWLWRSLIYWKRMPMRVNREEGRGAGEK
ncbi:MAG: DUF418 domain-containing protein [Bacteroidia bacterium]|nr:DUF418 domain-containing protein [Bacteroidia bacterium]